MAQLPCSSDNHPLNGQATYGAQEQLHPSYKANYLGESDAQTRLFAVLDVYEQLSMDANFSFTVEGLLVLFKCRIYSAWKEGRPKWNSNNS